MTATPNLIVLSSSETLKRCSRCKESLPITNFAKDNSRSDGLQTACKSCHKLYKIEKPMDPIYIRSKRLLRDHNLTIAQYEKLFRKQKGVCAICSAPSPTPNRRLAVDHDHSTGKIRGLLCSKCNHGLGLFHDRINLLLCSIWYLIRNRYGRTN